MSIIEEIAKKSEVELEEIEYDAKVRYNFSFSLFREVRTKLYFKGFRCGDYICFDISNGKITAYPSKTKANRLFCTKIVCRFYDWLVLIPSPIRKHIMRKLNIPKSLPYNPLCVHVKFSTKTLKLEIEPFVCAEVKEE